MLIGLAPTDRVITEPSGFVSPSGNVGCMVAVDLARCDIIDRDWSATGEARGLRVGLRQGISLAPGEQAQFVCAGDTAFGADKTLPYGQSITAGVLRCESAQ